MKDSKQEILSTKYDDNLTIEDTISEATTPGMGKYPWVKHILERDPTWAKDFNPRKI